MKELADILRSWEQWRGERPALATLVHSQGSSYRRPGARMLICPDGSTVGSLSGGCLEEEVSQRAREVLRTGQASLMEFDTRRRFGCHGTIHIFVEVARDNFFADLSAARQHRRRCRAITVFVGNESEPGSRILGLGECAPSSAFVQDIEPPIHLIIVGDGPDSSPLRAIAEVLGWSVFESERAADLPALADARTAVLIKTHNYGRDCAALQHASQLGLRYVGLLGPRKRRDQLLGDLLDRGDSFDVELFAPAGLDLHAETPEEIALAIAAEIQTVFADGTGESLRACKVPIHRRAILPASTSPATECELSAP